MQIKRDFFPDLDSDGARLGEAASVDISDMSLDKYQSRYTSEDNAAFLKLVEKHNQDIQRKHAWRFSEDKNELLLGIYTHTPLLIKPTPFRRPKH